MKTFTTLTILASFLPTILTYPLADPSPAAVNLGVRLALAIPVTDPPQFPKVRKRHPEPEPGNWQNAVIRNPEPEPGVRQNAVARDPEPYGG
ncbi:MAG: hypothetical protein M1839_003979 [Geoglossum umbratile]|nr:MAG: hypothetical protein M1839_003979 [Geoglossum umbratile]